MNFLRLLPVLISFLLLAAHFLRAGHTLATFALIFLLLVLFVKKPWVPRLMQMVLFVGAVEWLLTLVSVAQMRIEFGMPWTRMAIILGAVALFTLLSGLVFWGKALRNRYSGTSDHESGLEKDIPGES
jgi:hypothetical protein